MLDRKIAADSLLDHNEHERKAQAGFSRGEYSGGLHHRCRVCEVVAESF
jgi:hypothetical protein